MTQTPLTTEEIQQLAREWYLKLDVHPPVEEYRALLADEGLEMRFPEETAKGFEGFKTWYERVIRVFFDEQHIVKKVDVTSVTDEQAEVKVVVAWNASIWNPPAAKSERIQSDAYQTWIVVRSPDTQKPVIKIYIVDDIKYAPGSTQL